ncbi:MAG: dATP/dGTP pyrophosphohydrolase domain-containing protein [Caulobacterales bacterium]|jgi:NTP pyrophosphatase (non-canonical NTP hydrolase)
MAFETTASITTWGRQTFGPVDDLGRLINRAAEEFTELRAAFDSGDRDEMICEAADVVILLHRLVGEQGRDLAAAIDAKMQINRSRQWRTTGDGVGAHIKPETE